MTHYLATGEALPPPAPEDRACMALRHLALLVDLKGEAEALFLMRRHARGTPAACAGPLPCTPNLTGSEPWQNCEKPFLRLAEI